MDDLKSQSSKWELGRLLFCRIQHDWTITQCGNWPLTQKTCKTWKRHGNMEFDGDLKVISFKPDYSIVLWNVKLKPIGSWLSHCSWNWYFHWSLLVELRVLLQCRLRHIWSRASIARLSDCSWRWSTVQLTRNEAALKVSCCWGHSMNNHHV